MAGRVNTILDCPGFRRNPAAIEIKSDNASQSFRIDTIYRHSLKGKVQFGDIPLGVLCDEVFRDGRACARLLERHLTIWYPELEYVDGIGHDFVHKNTGNKLEAKSFTRNGLIVAPPNMTGKGRQIEKDKLHEAANELIYVLCDITKFPTVRVVFKDGSELIKKYSNGKIPYKDKPLLFGC